MLKGFFMGRTNERPRLFNLSYLCRKLVQMTVFLLSIGILAAFFVLMSVRLLFVKNGEFRGTCATQIPNLAKEGITCGHCGKVVGAGDPCGDPEKHGEMPAIKRAKS